ncbi:GH3 auxin-responsive promoter [Polaribacter reichenbachii]|uniref:GH3 auxin-responsive promoter n=1 Tax=Polaribacter reichenbachii TaxID=996801 RepID=A0A1B8U3F9_9FLAO|nr:GH3 auxin-responsive promoter family protein [Polaribacter reichenbachii]APZ46579.1 GH3 auxin-responsive promoter [Polaribacter reichenbachii]AUC17225.1 GH3 auxin-responsive promoter [Polaribacter reichenbachii]OBY66403.1 GH3 auxin-responsive promoter [Polaribacter reichenbachii]
MAILGNIIKGVINLTDTLTSETNHIEAQEAVLKNLLETAKETQFGKKYSFETILLSDDICESFADVVPYFDYNKINEKWWSKLHKGEVDVTWPGTPSYFALSSGTTGKSSKRIPVTDAMIDAIQSSGIKQVLSLNNFDLPADFFEKEIMMLGSSTDLQEKNDHLEGEISGISASNIPFWFKGYYKPGEDIAKIDDWDERVAHIAKNAKNWDIGALSGIPSWIELMLQEVIKYHKADNIHDIWPNLQVYTSGGVAFGPYEKSFKALLGKPVTVIDTYLASEGYIATQTRPETDAMQLNTENGIYFEFVPMNPDYIKADGSIKKSAPSLTLKEVELNQDYILIMSTVSGAWRYLIGDTIAFTDVEKAEIKITGRTKFFLNTVGSQLSVNKMDDAMKHLEEKFSTKISEYTICAKRFDDGEFYHSWYLGTDLKANKKEVADALDNFLKEANKNYKVARSKALKGVKVTIIDVEKFHNWSDQNKKKGGQVKMERVMKEKKFKKWEKFVK